MLNKEQKRVLKELHALGYAICIFTPEELGEASPEDVEDLMCQHGWAAIEYHNERLPC